MKKQILFTLLISGLILGLFLSACENDVPEDVEPTLVCFGDSITAGYGATRPGAVDESKSYPAFLQEKVNIPVINAGLSGDRTELAKNRVNSVLSYNPQIVIILLGANDVYEGYYDAIEGNLQQIISRLNNGGRKIYLVKFYTDEIALQMANQLAGSLPEGIIQNFIEMYDTMFNDLAISNNVTLIDNIWDDIWGVPEHMSNPIHPNEAGYEIMADNIFKAIKPYLQTNGFLKIE